MRLEDKLAQLDQALAAGQDPPEGGQWGGRGIEDTRPGVRVAYRDHCELEEVLVAGGDPNDPASYGIYTYPHAGSLSRFP